MKIKEKLLLFLAEYGGSLFIRALGATLRIRTYGRQHYLERQKGSSHRVVYSFWHCNILPLAITYKGQGARVMISKHNDGEIIARIVHRLGFKTERGSTTRGGARALKALVRIRNDPSAFDIAITPDGPRGPAKKAQSGAVFIAAKTGFPLAPVGVAIEKAWVLGSWDGFRIPKPFSRCAVVTGEDIHVARDCDEAAAEEMIHRLEESLEAAEKEAFSRLKRWDE